MCVIALFLTLKPVCPLPAPVPVRGAEEAAVAGHGADHPTGQQLVSCARPEHFINPSPAVYQ